jgi:hypothetical protein
MAFSQIAHKYPFKVAISTRPKRRISAYSVSESSEDEEERDRTSKMDFIYMSPEAVARMERELEEARDKSMQEYEDLKALLLKRTWRFGTAFAIYLLLTVSAEAAAAELVGSAASYGYFLWLIRDVDAYDADTPVPMRAAEMVEPQFARTLAKIGAAYRMSFNPRLLVLIGLLGGCAAWNANFPDMQLSAVTVGCALGGYLSYKVALILKIYDDLKPRALTEEEMMQLSRPQLAELEDVPLNLVRPSEAAAKAAQAGNAAAVRGGTAEGGGSGGEAANNKQ